MSPFKRAVLNKHQPIVEDLVLTKLMNNSTLFRQVLGLKRTAKLEESPI
jgi:hypothetical protein